MNEINRRKFLQFLGMGAGVASIGFLANCSSKQGIKSSLLTQINQLKGIKPSNADKLVLAPGLKYQKIISYEDKINSTEIFGFNNDYIAIEALGSNKDDFLMWVNHEYIHPLFCKTLGRTKKDIEKEKSLVGGSIIRVKYINGQWQMIDDERNRGVRGDTEIEFANNQTIMGSKTAIGTLGNCAGGKTPWGTFLSCEENYHDFYGERDFKTKKVVPSKYGWEKYFNYPPEHYGWVVEIDPQTGKAKKHISMGRFAHESATVVTAKDGTVVVYSGDDKNDEHLYKFVSKSKKENKKSLEEGVLYVADMKRRKWLALDLDLSPKLKEVFKSNKEVLTYAREAAKLLGATPLDRPEDIEVHPFTGEVFVALTNNKPKKNYHGSILKISEDDYVSTNFKSETFYLGQEGGLSCPDNLAFDSKGNLWVATDISGSSIGKKPYQSFGNNGLFVIPVEGAKAGEVIQVASAPIDAEFTGLCFSPDYNTLFVSVQHPGERSKSLDHLTSHWPDGGVPKPSVVAISGM